MAEIKKRPGTHPFATIFTVKEKKEQSAKKMRPWEKKEKQDLSGELKPYRSRN